MVHGGVPWFSYTLNTLLLRVFVSTSDSDSPLSQFNVNSDFA